MNINIKRRTLLWIMEAIDKAGGEKELALSIGVKTETVRSWVRVSNPRLEHIERVLKFLNEK